MIKAESADCDQCLIAHRTPIEPDPVTHLYPQKLVDIVARGAARRAIAGAMFENVATKIPQERLDATARSWRWLRGTGPERVTAALAAMLAVTASCREV